MKTSAKTEHRHGAGNRYAAFLPAIASAVFLSTEVAFGAEIAYKNNAYQWNDGSWEGGVKPGPNDTALIPELPILKARYDAGRMQSNGLLQDEEIQTLRFSDLYGMSVQGTYRLTLNSIVCDDIFPSPEDTAQIATNKVATQTLALKGSEAEFQVGANHVLVMNATTLEKADEGVSLVKTGPGTVLHSGQTWNPTNSFWVKEGTYIRSGTGYPEFKGDVIVGGAGKDAVLVVQPSANQTLMPATSVLDIREKGRVELPDIGKYYYHETLKIDHGVLDGNGTTFCMSNQGATECGTEYTLCGGIVTNGTLVWIYGGVFTIGAAEIPSVLHGTLDETAGALISVPDGTAAVDFVLDGRWGGGNRQYGKTGAGTMLFIDRDPYTLYGIGRDFKIEGGTFILQSETGIGLGTNNIVVSAGATFGGTGYQVGGIDPAQSIRGLRGNVVLNGTSGNYATIKPGTMNYETGAFLSGTFRIGSETQTNNVISSGYAELRCHIDRAGASCLAVNGLLQTSATDTLAIVTPEKIPTGAHTLATFSNGIVNPFETVTVNGVDITGAPGTLAYLDAAGNRIATFPYYGAGTVVYTKNQDATVFMVR